MTALAALRIQTMNGGSNALARAPLRRAAIMAPLERAMGVPSRSWCCLDDARLAAPIVDPAPPPVEDAQALSTGEVAFFRHCALCHRGSDAAPPNFMAGTLQQVRANLNHCAQRLHVRMAMWARAPDLRGKTPMPPPTALSSAGIDEAAWRGNDDLAALRGYIANLLQREDGKGRLSRCFVGCGLRALARLPATLRLIAPKTGLACTDDNLRVHRSPAAE